MRKIKNKIAAFTLVEITIVLLLSLLLIGIVMLGYRHFEQYRANQKNKTDELSEILLMHTRLKNCFDRAWKIKRTLDENELIFEDTLIFAKCGIHEKGLVFNQNNRVDSVQIELVNLQIGQIPNSELIKSLSFEPKNNIAQRRFFYQKEYSMKMLYKVKETEYEY